MDISDINIQRAGEFFIYSIWLQSQMGDLIILRKYPDIIEEFITIKEVVPKKMSIERESYWKKQFAEIKREFVELFGSNLLEEDIKDLDAIYNLRNAIAHSHISLGRDYFLYRPARGEKQEMEIVRSLDIPPRENASDPMILKLSFHDDEKYFKEFNRIKRLDEICFKRIADLIKIPHSRVR